MSKRLPPPGKTAVEAAGGFWPQPRAIFQYLPWPTHVRLLAALGLRYDSEPARDVARCLAAVLRGHADFASARSGEAGALRSVYPPAPLECAVPGLAEAARAARTEGRPRHLVTTAIRMAGAADALLGVETGGIAPCFAWVSEDGDLTRTARAWLDARGMSGERALAIQLSGGSPFPVFDDAAHGAMRDAVAPFMHRIAAAARCVRRFNLIPLLNATFPGGVAATPTRRRWRVTKCCCAQANMTTARWGKSSLR